MGEPGQGESAPLPPTQGLTPLEERTEETRPAKQAGSAQGQTRGPRVQGFRGVRDCWDLGLHVGAGGRGSQDERGGGHREGLRGVQQADRFGCGRVFALRADQDVDGRVGWAQVVGNLKRSDRVWIFIPGALRSTAPGAHPAPTCSSPRLLRLGTVIHPVAEAPNLEVA